MVCKKIDNCGKITMILDHDLMEFQYAEAIKSVCGKCAEPRYTVLPCPHKLDKIHCANCFFEDKCPARTGVDYQW